MENSNQIFNPANLRDSLTFYPLLMEKEIIVLMNQLLASLEENGQVLFRYSGNPNGSINDIAGIRNKAGNIYKDDASSGKRQFLPIIHAWMDYPY